MVCIPVEKIVKGHQMITKALNKKRSTIRLKNLQQITGFLNFLGKAIVPGRAFTRRLYAHENKVLKAHHHIDMNTEMKDDLRTWKLFLESPEIYSRSFMDFNKKLTSQDIDMYTDASANPNLGCGGYSENNWFILQWDEVFMKKQEPSINYLELYAVSIAIFNWIYKYKNKRITLFCDNMSVVHMINNSSSKCKNCMVLIRLIVLKSMIHNVKIQAKHVAGKLNKYSDYLSRLQYQEFRKPSPIPEELWPIEKIWKDTKQENSNFNRGSRQEKNQKK